MDIISNLIAYILYSTLKQLLEDFKVTPTLLQTLIQFNDLELNNRIKNLNVLITGKDKARSQAVKTK